MRVYMRKYFSGEVTMANDRGCSDKNKNCRLGKVGGQAVLEGIMMKAGTHTVTTCRKENGELVVYNSEFVSVRKKHKFLNIPILRGVVNFIEMMALSMKTLSDSADALGIEEEEGKVEPQQNIEQKVGGRPAVDMPHSFPEEQACLAARLCLVRIKA